MKLNANFSALAGRDRRAVRALDAAAMREITGTLTIWAACYTPGAVMIQPADYIRAFAAGLGPKIDIYENSPVMELDARGRLDGADAERAP